MTTTRMSKQEAKYIAIKCIYSTYLRGFGIEAAMKVALNTFHSDMFNKLSECNPDFHIFELLKYTDRRHSNV